MSALAHNPGLIKEADLIAKLRANEWHLITTENAACVVQFCETDGRRYANILAIGGVENGSLSEIMTAYGKLSEALRYLGFSYITGQPRKEWHRFLISKYGFEQQGTALSKEL